jgi:ribose-phosphate pyrophosphokinase
MTTPIAYSLFGADPILENLERGSLTYRLFPDKESYLRFEDDLEGKEVLFVDSLYNPNIKILPLIFAAKTAKDLGAKRVGLVAPYLAYMRQDARFNSGEAITAIHFAELISDAFDWMITVDPHLHRIHSLKEVYTIPTQVISAAPAISQWILASVQQPLLIGPDSESEQWVAEIAKMVAAPYVVLEKKRYSDTHVDISLPDIGVYSSHTPVLVDDIISTGRTMIETICRLKALKAKPPICIGVHAIFSGISTDSLIRSGAAHVVTCNTIIHDSNGIDLSPCILDAIKNKKIKGGTTRAYARKMLLGSNLLGARKRT